MQVSKECYEACRRAKMVTVCRWFWKANLNMKQGHLDLPPTPSNSDKWRFIGIPNSKCNVVLVGFFHRGGSSRWPSSTSRSSDPHSHLLSLSALERMDWRQLGNIHKVPCLPGLIAYPWYPGQRLVNSEGIPPTYFVKMNIFQIDLLHTSECLHKGTLTSSYVVASTKKT